MAAVSSHLFAAGDIDYINNLNLVRTDISGLVTEANAKGTMSTQNANAVTITGGSFSGLSDSSLTGSLGVGTASPFSALHTSKSVSGAFTGIVTENTSASSVSSAGVLYRTVNGDWYLTASRDGYFSLKGTLGSEVWRVAGATNNLLLSTTTDNGTDKLQVNGGVSSAGRIVSTSSIAGVGYAIGAGGSVSQGTSNTTAVTINKICGVINTFGNTIPAASNVTFTVNNSSVSSGDVVVLSISGGTVSSVEGLVVKTVTISNGSFAINIYNSSVSNSSAGYLAINFAVIKAVAA